MEKNVQTALYAAVEHAIRSMGLAEFKKTSFFISSYSLGATEELDGLQVLYRLPANRPEIAAHA